MSSPASSPKPLQAPTLWTDGKRHLWMLSPAMPILALILIALVPLSGWQPLCWSVPALIYGLIPLLDRLIGSDQTNPPESAVARLEDDRYYRLIVYAYIPSQYAVTILGAWMAMNMDLPWWHLLGLTISVGMINGVGINTAHELGHKKGAGERWLAKLTLAPVAYGHFFVEHNKGHHKNVATPEDPASSRMGETFWAFLPRSMRGSLTSAWSIEKDRLARLGQGAWSTDNENLRAWSLTVLLFGALALWLGWPALIFLVVQAFVGASLLEVINYVEHYGLARQKLANGRYERCAPAHSWNSNHIVTNLVLYQLQRHSDHHANPTRRFQSLRHFDDSPQLPSGYASMLIPAYIPWLWFRQMDPLVVKHYGGDLSRAHLQPGKRETLLARWNARALDDGHSAMFPGESGAPAIVSLATRYQCTDCGYVYDENLGCTAEGFAPGTPWSQIPDHWACPDCAVREKPDFVAVAASSLPAA